MVIARLCVRAADLGCSSAGLNEIGVNESINRQPKLVERCVALSYKGSEDDLALMYRDRSVALANNA